MNMINMNVNLSSITETVGNLLGGIKSGAGAVWRGVSSVVTGIWNTVYPLAKGATKFAVSPVGAFVGSVIVIALAYKNKLGTKENRTTIMGTAATVAVLSIILGLVKGPLASPIS